MNFRNPTRLQLGRHGNFSGTDYTLVGRVVMGVTDNGENYFWNEFNLESRSGARATLVFEETERGGVWRLFTMFEPEYPLTAAEAATKQLGDKLNLTGTDVRVTLRDTSRVYFIEGRGPDGLNVGDVADYFNAEASGMMQVVSWTGEEVEFYNGVNLSAGVVNSAFNLPFSAGQASGTGGFFPAMNSYPNSGNYLSGGKFIIYAVIVVVFFFVIAANSFSCAGSRESAPVKHMAAGVAPFTVGAKGKIKAVNYRATAHAVVEIAEVGSVRERHEYQLTDDDGKTALLVCGMKNSDDWMLFTDLSPVEPPRAEECAAKKLGDFVNVDGVTGTVREIFQSTVRSAEGAPKGGLAAGGVFFAYLAQSDSDCLLALWNREAIYFQRGQTVSARAISAALTDPAWK